MEALLMLEFCSDILCFDISGMDDGLRGGKKGGGVFVLLDLFVMVLGYEEARS